MNTREYCPPLETTGKNKKRDPDRFICDYQGKIAAARVWGPQRPLLHHFLRTENPGATFLTLIHLLTRPLPVVIPDTSAPHSPREEPPGLSSSTFQGSSPCCNREITFGFENGSPVNRQKEKEKKDLALF